jgi:FlaA1/EpsC-like NDP-sugar epimerase
MIVGAGSAGLMILRDIRNSHTINDEVVCFIDDDNNKRDRIIEGVPVVGGREDITRCVEEFSVDKIYLALPSVSASTKRDILNICSETDCELKQLPGMYQLVSGQISVSHMRNVSVEDLLGREPIEADLKEVFEFINGKTVLVTGGGGSIGSELCRQIAGHDPKKLVIFDIYENNAYDLQQELKKKYPDLNFEVEIGSVRDSRRLCHLFNKYHPDVVYHAAAHKHVPLMEVSPNETIKNNVIGTYKTAYAAMAFHCKRFVLISTDKAVNPTNIMGASKRMCEMIIQSFAKKIKEGKADEIPFLFTHEGKENFAKEQLKTSKTEFVAVRFGNVLGSNGSVIPLFKKQIEAGGPVTVTHKDIVRYFMTIPEAVSLVLQAGAYAEGGEIFVLDMGEQVRIYDLAYNLIKLSGFEPEKDIEIVVSAHEPAEERVLLSTIVTCIVQSTVRRFDREVLVSIRDRGVSSAVAAAEKADTANPGHVAAPFQGAVTVTVEKGEEVEAGQTVATIEAMKMEAAITAPRAGTVERLAFSGTQTVDGGDLVLVLG